LLVSQSFDGNQKIKTEDLEEFLRQKPNKRILYLPYTPYLYAYNAGKIRFDKKQKSKLEKKRLKVEGKLNQKITNFNEQLDSLISKARKEKKFERDSSKIVKKQQLLRRKKNNKLRKIDTQLKEGNWFMRAVGEPPAIYDTTSAQFTLQQAEKYLKSKGFFDSKVLLVEEKKKKKISLTYQIEENTPYQIREINYNIPDTSILQLVRQDSNASFIQIDETYDERNLSKERNRLNRFLQNKGYFGFNVSYIFLR